MGGQGCDGAGQNLDREPPNPPLGKTPGSKLILKAPFNYPNKEILSNRFENWNDSIPCSE